ncbi:MAG: serine/threonine protein kinase [Planctomycetes bacterium]|nr:serine/threonine protein kinase [Planctomycetota bacterium]
MQRTPQPMPSIGPYRVLERIGTGGMGEVYRAERQEPRQTVAIKLIKPGMATRDVLARFDLERRALAAMHHDGIAKIFDAGTTEDASPYFVMEFVDGIPITQFFDENELSISERIRLLQQVCIAVQHAHQKGVIHRDLKPSNILVAKTDENTCVKVLDFGLAKATAHDFLGVSMQTEVDRVLGTLEYMSPEQAAAADEVLDLRADVYSIGVVLYEVLTGTLPFSPGHLRKLGPQRALLEIQQKDPPRPSVRLEALDVQASSIAAARRSTRDRLLREVRGDLDWITMMALAKEPERRYSSAVALAEDLQRHLDFEPVHARPPSKSYRVRKFARRNRFLLSAASALVAALCVGLIGTWLGFREAKENAFEAQRQRTIAEENLATAEMRAAGLAVRRGAWGDALDAYRRAETLGYSKLDDIQFGRIEAWEGMLDQKRARRAVDDALTSPSTPLRAKLLLTRAVLTPVTQRLDPRWREDIEAALAVDTGERLSLAEVEVAQSLLSRTLADSIQHLRAALRADAYCRRAHLMLPPLLIVTGSLEDASLSLARQRAIYADDPLGTLLEAFLEYANGDNTRGNRALSNLEGVIDEASINFVRIGLRLLATARNRVDRFGRLPTPSALQTSAFMAQLLADIMRVMPSLQRGQARRSKADAQAEAFSLTACLHPILAEQWSRLVPAFVAWNLGAGSDELLEKLDRSIEIHRDGFLLFARAALRADTDPAEAENDFYEAARASSLIPVPVSALFGAIDIEHNQLEAQTTKDRGLTARLRENLERYLAVGDLNAEECRAGYLYARHHEHRDLAERFLARWRVQDPGGAWRGHEVFLAYSDGELERAIALGETCLSRDPTNSLAANYTKKSRDLLEELWRSHPPETLQDWLAARARMRAK